MANQTMKIEELGYARHGYPAGTPPKTVSEVESIMRLLTSSVSSVREWGQSLERLLAMSQNEFLSLGGSCCRVKDSVADFPEGLKGSDREAYVFTNRDRAYGIQRIVGAQSGYVATRVMNDGKLSGWTFANSGGSGFAVFGIDTRTGMLTMCTEPGYSGANFVMEDGMLAVTI